MCLKLHDEMFDIEEADEDWIPAVSSKGWVILTADTRIEREHLESVIQNRCRVVLLTDNTSGAVQWTAAVIRALEQISDYLRNCHRPSIVRVSKLGDITRLRGPVELQSRLDKFKRHRIIRGKRHPASIGK